MNPIGQEEDNLISYLGYLARSKVRIVYPHWRLVPQKAKDLIWAQILQNRTGRSFWRLGKILNFLKKLKPIERGRREISIHIACPEPPARPPRHQKWKAARMKGDKYINADVAEVASKIDSLEQQSSQGSFTPATRMDILSTAIGKADYLDACRGEPRGVSVAKFLAGVHVHMTTRTLVPLVAKFGRTS
ncbi:hypothetical protein K1719_008965 [Acacia pycnantha]|nr:hypothetical protein K1719_008965 [Acacia pycnantha]